MSFNFKIWKYLYEKGLRSVAEIKLAAERGILTAEEKETIINQ